MFVVVSLQYSMGISEDEYPVSNASVSIHMITESKEKATTAQEALMQRYDAVSVIETPLESYVAYPTPHLKFRSVHDTLQPM